MGPSPNGLTFLLFSKPSMALPPTLAGGRLLPDGRVMLPLPPGAAIVQVPGYKAKAASRNGVREGAMYIPLAGTEPAIRQAGPEPSPTMAQSPPKRQRSNSDLQRGQPAFFPFSREPGSTIRAVAVGSAVRQPTAPRPSTKHRSKTPQMPATAKPLKAPLTPLSKPVGARPLLPLSKPVIGSSLPGQKPSAAPVSQPKPTAAPVPQPKPTAAASLPCKPTAAASLPPKPAPPANSTPTVTTLAKSDGEAAAAAVLAAVNEEGYEISPEEMSDMGVPTVPVLSKPFALLSQVAVAAKACGNDTWMPLPSCGGLKELKRRSFHEPGKLVLWCPRSIHMFEEDIRDDQFPQDIALITYRPNNTAPWIIWCVPTFNSKGTIVGFQTQLCELRGGEYRPGKIEITTADWDNTQFLRSMVPWRMLPDMPVPVRPYYPCGSRKSRTSSKRRIDDV